MVLESLDLFASVDSRPSTPSREREDPHTETTRPRGVQTYSAMMRFNVVELGSEKREMSFALAYDVRFVTAHPCVPSHTARLLNSPTSPTFHIPDPPPESHWQNHGPHRLFVGKAQSKTFIFLGLLSTNL